MLQSLFIVWRESVEALLVVGILHAWLCHRPEPVRGLRYRPNRDLEPGAYFWRVASRDGEGRPGRFGNLVTKADFDHLQRILSDAGHPPLKGTWQEHAVKCFDAWIGGEIPEIGEPPTHEEITRELRGKNLACWCKPGTPCHADVLLALANPPTCEEISP